MDAAVIEAFNLQSDRLHEVEMVNDALKNKIEELESRMKAAMKDFLERDICRVGVLSQVHGLRSKIVIHEMRRYEKAVPSQYSCCIIVFQCTLPEKHEKHVLEDDCFENSDATVEHYHRLLHIVAGELGAERLALLSHNMPSPYVSVWIWKRDETTMGFINILEQCLLTCSLCLPDELNIFPAFPCSSRLKLAEIQALDLPADQAKLAWDKCHMLNKNDPFSQNNYGSSSTPLLAFPGTLAPPDSYMRHVSQLFK